MKTEHAQDMFKAITSNVLRSLSAEKLSIESTFFEDCGSVAMIQVYRKKIDTSLNGNPIVAYPVHTVFFKM